MLRHGNCNEILIIENIQRKVTKQIKIFYDSRYIEEIEEIWINYFTKIPAYWLSGRVFANGPGDWVQSQVETYQRLKNWYLIPPWLTLSIIKYVSRVKWSNPGKGVAPCPTLQCSTNWKGSFRIANNNFTKKRIRGDLIETFKIMEFLIMVDKLGLIFFNRVIYFWNNQIK